MQKTSLIHRIISLSLSLSLFFVTAFPQGALATSVDIKYDAAGNMIQKGARVYEYNDEGRLVKIKEGGDVIVEFRYDHEGRRIKKVAGGRVTLYPERHYLVDSVKGATSYYFLNKDRVAEKDSTGRKFFYHNDHLGGTSVVTDSSGQVARWFKYYPYGLPRMEYQPAGEAPLRHQFTGQENDQETRLYYYGDRYYDPQLRRFISTDPVLPIPAMPQTINPYAYCLNNPVKFTDPNGRVVPLIFPALIIIGGVWAEYKYLTSVSNPTWDGVLAAGFIGGTKEAVGYLAGLKAAKFGIAAKGAVQGGAAKVFENVAYLKNATEGVLAEMGKGAVFAKLGSYAVDGQGGHYEVWGGGKSGVYYVIRDSKGRFVSWSRTTVEEMVRNERMTGLGSSLFSIVYDEVSEAAGWGDENKDRSRNFWEVYLKEHFGLQGYTYDPFKNPYYDPDMPYGTGEGSFTSTSFGNE